MSWVLAAFLGGVAVLASAGPGRAVSDLSVGAVSGLPVPRFVSLKSDRVNVRTGPTKDQSVAWLYTRTGLPVEITAEFENWRRIRDSEGSEGWVYHSLLSGRRTGLVIAKTKNDLVPLYEKPDVHAALAAELQPGVQGAVRKCTGTWCHLVGDGYDGWIPQERLWGVYPGEKVE